MAAPTTGPPPIDVFSLTVLHPRLKRSVQLWNTADGLDGTASFILAASRLYLLYLSRVKPARSDAASESWNALRDKLNDAGRILRIVKPLELTQLAVAASSNSHLKSHSARKIVENLALLGKVVTFAAFLAADTISWASSIKFIRLSPLREMKVKILALILWFSGISCSLIHGGLKFEEVYTARGKVIAGINEKPASMKELNAQQRALVYQITQDLLDIVTPASYLGLMKIGEGQAAVLGLISSIMALNKLWKKTI